MAAWQLAIALIVLAVVVFFLLKPISVRLPQSLSFLPFENVWFDFSTVPVLAVIFLLITTTISPSDAWDAIKGTSNLKPYAIIILFFALAYCSISLDTTGIFDFFAVKAVNASHGSGRKLFFAFFALSSIITVVTSNDIVILTLTPIITAVTQHANIDPMPLLYAQFFAANIWSMSLFIGNPTNIIVAQDQNIGFLQYSQWMILPTIAMGFTCLGVLFFLFKNKIPEHVDVPSMDPMQNFRDVPGAIFGSIAFGTCILLLAFSNWLPVPLWTITAICAGVMLTRDLFFDFKKMNQLRSESAHLQGATGSVPDYGATPKTSKHNENTMVVASDDGSDNLNNGDLNQVQLDAVESPPSPAAESGYAAYKTYQVLRRMPWPIVPFVIGVFIIVQALSVVGFTQLLAQGLGERMIGPSNSSGSIMVASVVMTFLTALICNLLNNQPMTILFTKVLDEPLFRHIGPSAYLASTFAIIMGSNIGGNMTLVGALAGIMWSSILSSKGITISALQFAKYGFGVMIPVALVGSLILGIEHVIIRPALPPMPSSPVSPTT